MRRDHYIRKLEIRTGTRYNVIEAALKVHMAATRPGKPVRTAAATPTAPLLSSPIEEECLSLLLQHPELKDRIEEFLPEYFQNSQNREVFVAWQQSADLESLKERLDPTMWEQVDALASRSLLTNKLDKRLPDYVRRLREEYLRDLKAKEAAVHALVGEEEGGNDADLATLQEQGLDTNTQLLEVFQQKARANRSARDEPG